MTSFVLSSVAGAPGVSTLAVGIAATWPEAGRRRVLVEADADGGKLGTVLGVGTEPGLMSLAVAARARRLDPADVEEHAVSMGDWSMVAAPASAEQSTAALVQSGATIARTVADERSTLWVVDTGRLSQRSPAMPFAVAADLVMLVTTGDLAALQLVPTRADVLLGAGCAVGVVLVGDSDWSLAEIADFCGSDVLGRVPSVRRRRTGADLSGSEWRPWWHAVRGLCAVLLGAQRSGLAR